VSAHNLTTPRPLWAGRALALAGILLVSLSLRILSGCLAPIYGLISKDIDLPPLVIALIGALAPAGFAVASILAPRLGRAIGIEAGLIIAVGLMLVAHTVRAVAPGWILLAAASALGLIGAGIGNVLLPPAVKKYFPDRIGLVTTLYVSVMAASATLAPLIAYPMSEALGWREGTVVWIALTFTALVPWLAELRQSKRRTGAADEIAIVRSTLKLRKSPTALAIAITLAVSSLCGYICFSWLPPIMIGIAGVTPADAGTMLALFAFIGLPAGLVVPVLAARIKRTDRFLYLSGMFFVVGYGGLLLWPTAAPWLWIAIIGAGPLIFPLTLTLINLRTKTTEASLQLSGFAQVVAYSIAVFGPIVVGLIRALGGSWQAVVVFMLVISLPVFVAAPILGRGKFVEDEVEAEVESA
jgi:CP family cyanate transporter-like MFS transporter